MSSARDGEHCEQSERICEYAVEALPVADVPAFEAHLTGCASCRRELAALGPVVDAFVDWPTDVLRPPASLETRLAARIAAETGEAPVQPPARAWVEPAWEEAAPGIFVKLLANDRERDIVSMLVRLLPNVEYPPHTHAGVEELFLLDGELWIDDRKLNPGDYSHAVPGTGDRRVWSETGCTCVLITSTEDALG